MDCQASWSRQQTSLTGQEDEEDTQVLDFVESFFQEQEPEKLAQPRPLQVPEIFFKDCFDYRVDLWRTGCTVRRYILLLKITCLRRYKR
jgi:hypothetical protein